MKIREYTIINGDRILKLQEHIGLVISDNIPGDIVECGTFKGGSAMIMANRLIELNKQDREIRIFDTFEGMPTPGEHDIKYNKHYKEGPRDNWNFCPLEEVKTNLKRTGYPSSKLHFIKGMIEDTLPKTLQKK